MKKIHLTATRVTVMLTLLFVLADTLVLGMMYPATLRMMALNCSVDDHVFQLFRWPWLGALMMALAASVPMIVIALVLRALRLSRWMPIGVVASLALAYCYPPSAEFMWGECRLMSNEARMTENLHRYELLAGEKKWSELKRQVVTNGDQNQNFGMRYMLLAESALGTLTDNAFLYPISETEQLLFRGLTDMGSSVFNRHFYENIGIYDECYHQAQEHSMLFADFCIQDLCMMTRCSIEACEWDLADKFLTVLEGAWSCRDFVSEQRALVEAGRKAKKVSTAPLRANNFVTGYPLMSEMFHNYKQHIGDEGKCQEYMLLCLLIRKDVSKFVATLRLLPQYEGADIVSLPENYQQAIQIYISKGEALRDAPYGTYAHYYYNTPIPEEEQHPEPRMVN